jgi:hypothetical protein
MYASRLESEIMGNRNTMQCLCITNRLKLNT